MGVDKATLAVDGESLARRAARVLAAVCDPAIELGPGASGLRTVREDPPGSGPLAALVAGVDALGTLPVVLLACDMPFVDVPLLSLVANRPGEGSVVAIADERAQYGCARYGATSIALAREALARGERSFVRALANDDGITWLTPNEWGTVAAEHAFCDLDTPDDMTRFGFGGHR
jgi:molybdopterin-guanine dinucleotide biosynthesis protein A